MPKLHENAIHLLFRPFADEPIAYRVTTEDGLVEVSHPVFNGKGLIHYLSCDEFAQFRGLHLTDSTRDCRIGAVWSYESVFYIWLGDL